jgi:hypothetical protein
LAASITRPQLWGSPAYRRCRMPLGRFAGDSGSLPRGNRPASVDVSRGSPVVKCSGGNLLIRELGLSGHFRLVHTGLSET